MLWSCVKTEQKKLRHSQSVAGLSGDSPASGVYGGGELCE